MYRVHRPLVRVEHSSGTPRARTHEEMCTTLVEEAEDEFTTFQKYQGRPEPWKTWAQDELKHFSGIVLMVTERCPEKKGEIKEIVG